LFAAPPLPQPPVALEAPLLPPLAEKPADEFVALAPFEEQALTPSNTQATEKQRPKWRADTDVRLHGLRW
jgi:hypothetical protein